MDKVLWLLDHANHLNGGFQDHHFFKIFKGFFFALNREWIPFKLVSNSSTLITYMEGDGFSGWNKACGTLGEPYKIAELI